MAFICWFFFYHHPAHVNISINKSKGNSTNFGFNIDTTQSIFAPKTSLAAASARDQISGEIDQSNAPEPSAATEKTSAKLDVTLIDAFRIKELNLLIISYILRETHDAFIRQNFSLADPNCLEADRMQEEWYSMGAILGIIFTGIVGDIFLRNKHFL